MVADTEKSKTMLDKLIEKLARLACEQWSGWMEYLFLKSEKNPDGTVTIPKWAVERWERQMNTPYSELTEEEKERDREEATKVMNLLAQFLISGDQEGIE